MGDVPSLHVSSCFSQNLNQVWIANFTQNLFSFCRWGKKVRAIFQLSLLKRGNSQQEAEITVNTTLQLKFRPGLIKIIKKSCKVDKKLMITQPGM